MVELKIFSYIQGLNTRKGFDVKVAAEISKITGHKFETAPNKVGDMPQVLFGFNTNTIGPFIVV